MNEYQGLTEKKFDYTILGPSPARGNKLFTPALHDIDKVSGLKKRRQNLPDSESESEEYNDYKQKID